MIDINVNGALDVHPAPVGRQVVRIQAAGFRKGVAEQVVALDQDFGAGRIPDLEGHVVEIGRRGAVGAVDAPVLAKFVHAQGDLNPLAVRHQQVVTGSTCPVCSRVRRRKDFRALPGSDFQIRGVGAGGRPHVPLDRRCPRRRGAERLRPGRRRRRVRPRDCRAARPWAGNRSGCGGTRSRGSSAMQTAGVVDDPAAGVITVVDTGRCRRYRGPPHRRR